MPTPIPPAGFPPQPVTKAQYAVEVIRTAILVGDFAAGQRITEQQIKQMLGLSSSPVREAFNTLEAEGFLTKLSHVGTMVTKMEIEDTRELYRMQALLQSTCLQLVARKISDQDIREAARINAEMEKIVKKNPPDVKALRVLNYKLHIILCGVNIYPWMTRLVSALWIRLPTEKLWLIPGRPLLSVRQHEKIIEMVSRQDAEGASRAMREHLEGSMAALYP